MSLPTHPDWWPARQLQRSPVKKVLVCGRRLNPPLFSHVVNFPRLEIPLHGQYRNQMESGGAIAHMVLRPGMALFAAPNCWNLPEWQPGLELLSIFFGKSQLGVSLVSARSKNYPQLAAKKYSVPRPIGGPVPHLLNALDELLTEDEPGPALTDLVCALIHCVENLLRQPAAQPGSRAQSLLEDVRVFLQSHYQYEITRDSVAEQFNVTPNHLSRLFQTHGRTTFSGYLTQVRIDRAKHLLHNYNLKLDDIAARCGYHDTPYFCHVFKKMTKATPMQFRLKIRRTSQALTTPLPAG
ncbi:MAG: AraC family transcriptional regulator [Verrucomicrobiae bacterium]|nr:AraC family transcriptional regulator [Verrucomicrobiae bacterium]